MTTILIVAGETSGDLHGANLARELRALDPSVRLVGTGGRHMREAGVEVVHDTTAHAAVGMVEVWVNLDHWLRLFRRLQSLLKQLKPDVAVLIDSPDFNLPFAERAADHGIPVVYYVSPQIWAWRKGRIKTIRRVVRKMLVILDFEEKLYREAGVDVAFVGHPLLDAEKKVDRAAFRRELGSPEVLVGLLPGSRRKQFRWLLPIMRKAAELIRREIPGAGFVVGCAPAIDPAGAQAPGLRVVHDRTAEVMASSDVVLVASGTATLETAMYGTPMVVTYKLTPFTAYLFGPLVRMNTRHFSLVNILAGKRVVPELYQSKAKPELLAREALSILRDGRLPEIRRELAEVRRRMGSPGASRRAAEEVLRIARPSRSKPLGS
jgi:lipid-A-disaccharide synthase